MRDSNVMAFINDAIPGGSNGTANGINAARHSDRSHDRWAGPLRNQDAAPPTPETKTFQNEVAALRTEVFVPRGRFPSCTPAPQSSGRSPTRTTPQTNNRKNRSPTWPPIHALPCHQDTGLQPERTDLAWRRTSPSLVVAAAIIVRWMPHHGLFVGSLVGAAIGTALAINVTQKRRFHRATHGINWEAMPPPSGSTAAVAGSVVILALLGIYTVPFLPNHE